MSMKVFLIIISVIAAILCAADLIVSATTGLLKPYEGLCVALLLLFCIMATFMAIIRIFFKAGMNNRNRVGSFNFAGFMFLICMVLNIVRYPLFSQHIYAVGDITPCKKFLLAANGIHIALSALAMIVSFVLGECCTGCCVNNGPAVQPSHPRPSPSSSRPSRRLAPPKDVNVSSSGSSANDVELGPMPPVA